MTNKPPLLFSNAFERALTDIRTRIGVPARDDYTSSSAIEAQTSYPISLAEQTDPVRLAIAYSGGLDSTALLHLAHAYANAHGITLFAFHIHHGISPNADDWLVHCQRECTQLGIHFDACRVTIDAKDKSGVEEAARIRRYAALGALCRNHNVPLLLTAHHQDDQAETVLLQLLRGSGVAGLSGMSFANTAPDLLGDACLMMARPLLNASRAELAHFVADKEIAYIEDESNADTRYARNVLRHQVIPALAAYFPQFQARLARTAHHAQSAQRLLIELAAQDLTSCLEGECLNMDSLRQLSSDRIDNLLRYWFGSRGIRMPSTAWLSEMRTQLLEAKSDAQLCVTHADCHIRRHRNRVFLIPRENEISRQNEDEEGLTQSALAFRWNGEAQQMVFASYGGVLHFEVAEEGFDADWLQNQSLTIRFRSGGERLKLASNRSTKSLKYHYQMCDIPAWERERLPVIMMENRLLFAAGIGMDCHHLSQKPGLRIRFRWQQTTT